MVRLLHVLARTICAVPLVLVGCSSESARTDRTSVPVLSADGSLPLGQPYMLEVGTHCGVAVLGLAIDSQFWRTDEANSAAGDWMPQEWSDSLGPGQQLITIEVLLSGDGTKLTASAAGRSVSYRPVTDDDPTALCA